ncbi:hypothetical protein BG004_007420 [Podila humilis]|nr:hypothetical protein BG004_007420 [Podila humilis]
MGNRYEEFKEARVKEREQAIRSGAIPDPDKQMRLGDAITFVGTCRDMCPEFERHEREYQKKVESFKKIPGTNSINHSRAVKIYARLAAGKEQALPSDVRPPDVLLSTLDYLLNEIVAKGDNLHSSHAFVRDRTRSVRQDFTLQDSRGMEAIEAHEIIARYHILCAHQLCEIENFSLQQEIEQLEKVLTSLKEFYEDKRAEGIHCPNEAEFQAYLMLSRLRNPDMMRHAQSLPRHILQDPYIQAAADIHMLARQYIDIERQHDDVASRRRLQSKPSPNFFSRLFKKIAGPGTTYLMACLMETHFARIRKGALKAMNKVYMTAGVPSIDVVNALGFDDVSECIANCELYDLEVMNDDERTIIFNRRTEGNMRIFNVPSPLKPPLAIPGPTTSALSAVPPNQPPTLYNFAESAPVPRYNRRQSGQPQLTASQQPPIFTFKASAAQPSSLTTRPEEFGFNTPKSSKTSSGFSGTILTTPSSISVAATSVAPTLIPPPSPISTPKTNALTIVSRRGRIYPRSVVESILSEIIQEEVARIARQTVVQLTHDTAMQRSLKRAEEREHATRIEELRIMNGLMDEVISGMVRDVRSEIQRETKLQRWVIGQWKKHTALNRERAAEIQRRKDHYLMHVRAMSSRAGLGDDGKAIKIRDYKKTQMRSKKRSVSLNKEHDKDDVIGSQKDGVGGVRNMKGIKAMAEQVNRKKRRLDDVELDKVGYGSRDGTKYSSRDDALLAILKKAAEPLHRMWAPVAIQEIVENKFKETHSPGEGTTHPWRLFVNTPDFGDKTSKWLLTKLGTEMGRGTKVLQRTGNMMTVHRRPKASGIDVALHGIVDGALTDLLAVPRRITLQTSALMFVFSKIPFTDSQATEGAIHEYWQNERVRLVRFLACFPGVKQPLVFVMWGEQSIWEKISPDVVEQLGLIDILRADRSGMSKYRFVVMDMENVHLDRHIAGSLEWLATES